MSGTWIGELAQAGCAWIVAVSIQVSWLVLVVALLDRVLVRRVRPQLVAVLWLCVLVKLVLPPSLSSPWSLTNGSVGPALPDGSGWSTVAPGPAAALLAIWAVVAVGLGAVALRRQAAVRRILTATADQLPPTLRAQIDAAAAALGMRPPAVRIHPGAVGPAVLGLRRPCVVLPDQVVRHVTAAQQRHVLLHEFAHVRRRDTWQALLCSALLVVYWFHPLVWLALRRLSTLRELCCDQLAVAAGADGARSYRRTLLELARPLLEEAPHGQLCLIRRQAQIITRLEALERPVPTGPRGWRRHLAAAALVAFGAGCLPMAPRVVVAPAPGTAVATITTLPGCLQKRFAVFGLLGQASVTPSVPKAH